MAWIGKFINFAIIEKYFIHLKILMLLNQFNGNF